MKNTLFYLFKRNNAYIIVCDSHQKDLYIIVSEIIEHKTSKLMSTITDSELSYYTLIRRAESIKELEEYVIMESL